MVNYRLFCQHKHFDDCHPITAPLKRAFVILKKNFNKLLVCSRSFRTIAFVVPLIMIVLVAIFNLKSFLPTTFGLSKDSQCLLSPFALQKEMVKRAFNTHTLSEPIKNYLLDLDRKRGGRWGQKKNKCGHNK